MNVNCVGDDFYKTPFNVDFADKKFGYCMLAVFTKKGVFQRTYMIPANARKRVFARKKPYLSYEFEENNTKVYDMCEQGACSFDNEKAIIKYYNKTSEGFSKKRVYAIYFNIFKAIYDFDYSHRAANWESFSEARNPANSINYIHQLYGEEANLSNEDLCKIWQDLYLRVSLLDIAALTSCPEIKRNCVEPQYSSGTIRGVYPLFDVYSNGMQNTNLVKNKRIACNIYGIKAGDFDFPYLTVFTRNILSIIGRIGLQNSYAPNSLKNYCSLIINNYILNIKCFYYFFVDNILSRGSDGTMGNALESMFLDFRASKSISINFHNKLKLKDSLLSGIKLLSVIHASARIFNSSIMYNATLTVPYSVALRYIDGLNEISISTSGYFGNNEDRKAEVKDAICQQMHPKESYYDGLSYRGYIPEKIALPLFQELSPLSKDSSATCARLDTVLQNLRRWFCHTMPYFPVYDGKSCMLIRFKINENDKMEVCDIHMSGGE